VDPVLMVSGTDRAAVDPILVPAERDDRSRGAVVRRGAVITGDALAGSFETKPPRRRDVMKP
jgi:hypothetical protein